MEPVSPRASARPRAALPAETALRGKHCLEASEY